MSSGPTPAVDVRTRVDRWVEAGLISAAQADAIARWEAERAAGSEPSPSSPAPAAQAAGPFDGPSAARAAPASPAAAPAGTPPRRPLAVEALAYLGGTVILAALVVVTVGYWRGFSLPVRITIPGVATAVLLLAGTIVTPRLGPAALRMRSVLWLLSAATLAVLLVVVTDAARLPDRGALPAVAGGLVAVTAVLWLAHRTAAQQLAAFVSVELLAVALAMWAAGADGTRGGAVLAGIGILWGASAWRGLLPGTGRYLPGPGPATDAAVETARATWAAGAIARRWGTALGAAGTALGGIVLAGQQNSPWVGLIAVAVVVAVAIWMDDLAVLGIGALGTLIVLPMVVASYVTSVLSVAVVMVVAGAVLVGLAVLVARRRRQVPRPSGRHAPR